MHLQNKYIQIIHKNHLVVINLMKVSIFDLVKPTIVYVSHYANKNIFSSEIIVCRSLSNRGGRITFLAPTSSKSQYHNYF